jgi:signal transduction histidine kinase
MLHRARAWLPGSAFPISGLDAALSATVALLTLLTAVLLLVPGYMGHVVAPAADLVFDTIALVVSGSVAALVWVRYRESHLPIALYEAAAFLALTIADATAVAVAVRSSGVTDASIAVVGQSQFFVWAVARVLAAGLLVFGGAATLRGHVTRHPLAILFLPTALKLGVVVLAEMSGSQLPSLMATITPGSSPSDAPDLPVTAVGGTVLAMNAVLFLVSAALCRELARRGSRGDAYVAVGLVFAAFAQLHDALFPSTHPQEVASGDLLVLAFALVLLLGVEAEARFTLRALRHANESLERLRDAEVDRAALEERARLSRELHDGLAQDLWLAKLKAGRLAALPDLGPEATLLSEELGSAIDSGLAEAREAVMALRLGAGAADGAFGGLIRRVVDDFQDRFGLRAELERDDDLPSIPSRAGAELLRITQEALSNVRRHADATVVMVGVHAAAGQLTLTIRDNRKGFDTTTVKERSFGLSSMQERAALIGGTLTIVSAPSDGTTVTVVLPVSSEAGAIGRRT